MAISPSYENSNTLKKLTIAGATYFLKDADLRAVVESFGSVVFKDVVTTLTEDGANIATEKAVADFIKTQISHLEGVMHFVGVVTKGEAQTHREAIDAFYNGKNIAPVSGDVVLFQADGKEFICADKGTSVATAVWEEIGDQNIYETISHAASTYVPKTRTIAGVDLADDVTVEELSADSALNLKALSHKDSASGQIEVIDAIENISIGKAGDYTVTGQTSVDVPATFNALDVTPAGSVDITAGTAASAQYQKTSAVSIKASDPTEEQVANYTPAGSITLPGLKANITLNSAEVATVTDSGTAYSLSAGSVTKAEDTTSKFVKKGVQFSVDAETETLSLSYVESTDSTFYGDAVTAAGAVDYTAPSLSGSLPTFGKQEVALKTGASVDPSFDGTAAFVGSGAVLSTSLSFSPEEATVVQPTFTAAFTGTTKSVTPAAATTVAAAAVGGKVTVAAQDTAITTTKKSVTVTVQ